MEVELFYLVVCNRQNISILHSFPFGPEKDMNQPLLATLRASIMTDVAVRVTGFPPNSEGLAKVALDAAQTAITAAESAKELHSTLGGGDSRAWMAALDY